MRIPHERRKDRKRKSRWLGSLALLAVELHEVSCASSPNREHEQLRVTIAAINH